MVSRTETPRPLLTPGEVQQFSEHDEIVLVASTPPIRAEKAKYFLDPRFRARLLPAPTPKPLHPKKRPKDDWSALAPIAAPQPIETAKAEAKSSEQLPVDQHKPDVTSPADGAETDNDRSEERRAG